MQPLSPRAQELVARLERVSGFSEQLIGYAQTTGRTMVRNLLWITALTGILTACAAPPVHVSVRLGSTAAVLTFDVDAQGGAIPVRGLRVARSRLDGGRGRGSQGQILWALAAAGTRTRPLPAAIVYGVAPAGFATSRAEGLGPGEYEVEVLRDGPSNMSYFVVHSDGTIGS